MFFKQVVNTFIGAFLAWIASEFMKRIVSKFTEKWMRRAERKAQRLAESMNLQPA